MLMAQLYYIHTPLSGMMMNPLHFTLVKNVAESELL